MKKIMLMLVAAISACNAFAQTTSTITIRPHFNGKESFVGIIDAACNSSSTMHSTPVSNNVIFSYMAWTSGGCDLTTRALFRFDTLSDTVWIPRASTIVSARLYLYGVPSTPTGDYGNSTYSGSPYTSSGDNIGWLYELNSAFNPATTTWDNQPGVKHTDSVFVHASASQWGGNDTLDVTPLVADMVAHTNTGFELRMQTETTFRERLYASSRYSDTSLHPKLVVTYTTPPTAVNNVFPAVVNTYIYPNPVQNALNIKVTTQNGGNVSFAIYNSIGQKVTTHSQILSAGNNLVTIPFAEVKAGLYFVEISDGNMHIRQKFVKE